MSKISSTGATYRSSNTVQQHVTVNPRPCKHDWSKRGPPFDQSKSCLLCIREYASQSPMFSINNYQSGQVNSHPEYRYTSSRESMHDKIDRARDYLDRFSAVYEKK